VPEQGVEPFPVDLDAWEAWSPAEAARLLEGLEAPWYVAAGWALDLFLGRQTRPHIDLEVGIPGQRFAEVRERLGGYELVVVGDGHGWPLTESTLAAHHQTWVREPGGPWRVDVFREPWDGDVWICRRDPRIRLARDALISRSREGIPYAAPEVVLLFKAKATRPKDDDDFATVLPYLDAAARRWLRRSLELVHPGHRWLGELTY
jgi:Aminoglycoside-2''-adenylyltransferase